MLKLGVSMVGIAGLIFATTSWYVIPNTFKVIALILFGILFRELSRFSEIKLKLINTSKVYWTLAMLFFVFSYFAIGHFGVFGEWFSFTGEGTQLVTTILFLIISALSFISYKKHTSKGWIYISYTGLLMAMSTFIAYLNISLSVNLLTIIALVSLLNLWKKPNVILLNYLGRFLEITSLVITTIILINYIDSIDRNIYVLLSTSIISALNLLYITLKRNDEVFGIITPVLFASLVQLSIMKLELPDMTNGLLLTFIYALVYLIVMLSKLSLKNKIFNTAFQITSNFCLLGTFIYSYTINENIVLLVGSITLLTNVALLLFSSKLDVEIERYIQPIKILIFAAACVNWFNINVMELTTLFEICIYSIIMLVMYLITSKNILKYEYFLSFVILLVASLLVNLTEKEIIPSVMQLVLFIIPFLITESKEDKKYSSLTIPTFILLLLSTYAIFVNINFFELSEVLSSVTVVFIYLIIMFIYMQQKHLFTITSFAILLPYNTFIRNINCSDDIKTICTSLLCFYLLYLFCNNILKSTKSKNVVSGIFASLIMFLIIFKSGLIMGVYIGIISMILILVGFVKRDYRTLFIVGIIATIINIIFQLWELWSKVPFWLYILITGLTIIGIVTSKEIKKVNKKENN